MKKIFSYSLWIVGLVIILLVIGSYFLNFSKPKVAWGVTFSSYYAGTELGLNWKEAYTAILDDLKVDHLRLSAYWNEIEVKEGTYDFSDLDWQINEASKRNVDIVLAVGRRLPRWPECHDPLWLKNETTTDIQTQQLSFVSAVIKHYQSNKNISGWQIENEPYLGTFGVCPPLDVNFFKEEIALAKSLDSRPVMVTDSGELSTWIPAANSGGDVLGSTLYRVVYNPYIGYFHWPTPPVVYTIKVALIKLFSPIKKVIVAELQAESWHSENKTLKDMTIEEHNESLSVKQLADNISFTKKAGFDEAYLWGAEWWYYMKTVKNYPGYWDEAKTLWQNNNSITVK